MDTAPHETFLVVDSTTGQNAIAQAQMFQQAMSLTGIIMTKLDGTAKGGVVVAIRQQVGLPVKYVGVGEKPEDVALFDPNSFVDAMFGVGYMQAVDRLFQMEVLRRSAYGTLAAWTGRGSLSQDDLVRRVNIPRWGRESADRLRRDNPQVFALVNA